jgi:hypothetical protein
MVPANTDAVSVTSDPAAIRLLETARLVDVCAVAGELYRRPVRSIRTESEYFKRAQVRQTEAETTHLRDPLLHAEWGI